MVIDIDSNEGGDSYGYQLADDRFYLVVWVDKSRLEETRRTIACLALGQEALFGTIGCGERVWICRDESGFCIAVGDTDSKDVCYRISKEEIDQVLNAEVI